MSAPTPPAPETEHPAAWFLPAGAAIGFAGALCGIGGGIFAGPLLHSVRRVPLKRAAATAILVILATTLSSTAAELLRADSDLRGAVALPLAGGALVGAQLGYALSRRIAERQLKALFAFVLALAGLRLFLFSSALTGLGALEPRFAAALAFGIGLGGGALTPLLGVAGGVVMVPALFLLLGQPFGVARAAALAAGAVAALRSLWLHSRAGNVSFALGLPLAAGALLGALAGVVAAHQPTLAQGGRVLLAGILLAQALRFAVELARTRASRP
jgi:hypothetical protein